MGVVGTVGRPAPGNRLLMARTDVEALAGSEARVATSLAAWADSARRAREAAETGPSPTSAAALVIEDRAQRSRPADARAGR